AAHGAVPRPPAGRRVTGADRLRLWYPTPGTEAKMIEEGLPIGNGRIGGLVGGTPDNTSLFLTDASMWSGGANDTLDSAGQFPYERVKFGTFQLLGKARVRVPAHTTSAVTSYVRELDLSNGLVVTRYVHQGVTYTQEVFCSHPDDVIVIRLSQSGGGSYTGSVTLEGTRGEATRVDTRKRTAAIDASLGNGLKYAAVTGAAATSGKLGTSGQTVTFTGASEVVLVISGGTNYGPDAANGYRTPGLDPGALARTKLATALAEGGPGLVNTQIGDYRPRFDRFTLDLGQSTPEQRALHTAARLAKRAEPGAAADPEFEALYLQLARYLTITGSRDGLPMNLQGLWLEGNTPAWMGDYHTDINIQMNCWPTHRFGLAEHAEPLADYCLSQLPEWTRHTKALFNDPRNRFRNTSGRIAGWTLAFSTNIFGGNGWWWHPAGNAWLCLELWQHYEFTQDSAYLAKIMPLLRGCVEFWETRLITTTVGTRTVLVADRAWSPEHGPQNTIGNSYDQEVVHALFGNFVKAAQLLGTDAALADKAQQLRDQLYLPEISPKNGWLQEWMSPDYLGEPQHRHLSGLVGFYPGDRIRTDNQPAAYVEGVRKVLEARGLDSYGWACAWRAACWARLKDSNRAYLSILNVLRPSNGVRNGSSVNLFDMYDGYIFQIDANLGVPAAMLEMLVYSRPGVIDLMPAVPAAWKDGSVRGFGARGGFRLDMTWAGGAPTSVTLYSAAGGTTELRVGDWRQTVTVAAGGSTTVQPQGVPYPPPPPPPPPPPAVRIANVHSGLVMEVYGGSSSAGAKIAQWTDSGSTSQRWQQVATSDGYGLITSVRSGMAVDIPGSNTAEGTDLIQWSPNGGVNQEWKPVDMGNGQVKIVSRLTDKVIGVSGASTAPGAYVEIQTYTGHASQHWTITPS
ncbi:MAG: glycosyl hydrolase family 95 catalytic domain-containing protein, partial [Micromonosporaceae bacterium]